MYLYTEMWKALLTVVLIKTAMSEISGGNCTVDDSEAHETRILSRRKRFLTFPVGSSLQLVFCLQTAALIPIGDIFLYGNTAALAWNLPSDTMFLDDLKKFERAQRRGDNLKIGYVDENGRVIAKVPYNRRTIVNPAFAKRSVDDETTTFKEKLKLKIDRMKMHEQHTKDDYNKNNNLNKKSIEFHRSSRFELYGKIETLLTTLGRDGRQCVLYKLCESAQNSAQGEFMQEFLKAVFTLPEGNQMKEEYQEYDQAHSRNVDCSSKYPGCQDFLPNQI